MIPVHFSRELAAAKQCEYEHRAAVHRLARHLAAAGARPSATSRALHRLTRLTAHLRPRRPVAPTATLREATAPVSPSPAGVDCCACPCAA